MIVQTWFLLMAMKIHRNHPGGSGGLSTWQFQSHHHRWTLEEPHLLLLRTHQLPKQLTPLPLLAVWHGAVFAGGLGPAAAIDMPDYWQDQAEAHQFIVVAQAIIGSPGCNPCGWRPTEDSQALAAIIADLDARYNIETTRKYVWGFSAGGFVMHAIALNNADYFAGYAVSGAHLGFASSIGIVPAGATRQLPAYLSVGQSDSHFTNAQNDLTAFQSAGWVMGQNLWFDGFVGGHELLPDLPEQAWDKICISTNQD